MDRLGRLAQLIGLSTIPLAGVFWRSWSDATALAFYWCETALVVVFVAFRLILHRRRTNKRGHYVETKTSTDGGPARKGTTTYIAVFLTTATAFSVGNLVFLLALLGLFSDRVGGGEVDLRAVGQGMLVACAFVLVAFAVDVPGIEERPFAWARMVAEAALRRVFIIYAAIFIGVFCAIIFNLPRALFGVFFGLRLFTDVASNFRPYDPESPPHWMHRFVRKNWSKYETEWRTEKTTRLAREAADEGPYLGIPSPAPDVASVRR
jgi:hypothetical protein